jgi:hypothetical protein
MAKIIIIKINNKKLIYFPISKNIECIFNKLKSIKIINIIKIKINPKSKILPKILLKETYPLKLFNKSPSLILPITNSKMKMTPLLMKKNMTESNKILTKNKKFLKNSKFIMKAKAIF